MITWILSAMIAMGSPSSTVDRDYQSGNCDYADQCALRGNFAAFWQLGYTLAARADHFGCYPSANVQMFTLRIIPNSDVLTSCIDRDSYMVIYRLADNRIGYDRYSNGIETIRVLVVPEIR